MMDIYKTETVVCRPALPKDTEPVMELCSHIWEGGDYIPQVWSGWLADPEGLLGVAELGGRIAGVFKLTKFRDQEWYLEGLRVHPDFQGRGVAAHIHEYIVEAWRRMGSGIIRLVTASYNVKVHHMCDQSGFKRIAEFVPYRGPASEAMTDPFLLVTSTEAQKALDFVEKSPTLALSAGLVNLGWVFADPQLKHVQGVIEEKHAWWWRGGKGFISIWEDDEGDEREPGIQLIGCSLGDLPDFLLDYRRLMGAIGYKSAGWVAPLQADIIHSLEKAGFERAWDLSLYAYELRSEEP